MNKALIYCRVSTEEQATSDRHSLKTQLNLCEKAVEDGGFKLAENGVYQDPGRSATNMNRPGLQDMMVRVSEDKDITAVFVQDSDRLTRNVSDHLTIKAFLKKHGAQLVSVSQSGIEDTPEGNFMDLIIAGVGQFQSQITGRKTIKSMEQKFKDGGWPTHAPIGYLNVGDKENNEERIVVIDETRAPLIKEAFKMYATGNYSIIEVRDALYSKGFTARGGKLLQHSKMVDMLKNHFYYGEMRWRKMSNTGKHTPIIDKETFDRCQLVMANNQGGRCRRRKFNFILRGYVWCGRCGYRYTAEHHPKKNKSYYHCNHYGNKIPNSTITCADRYVEVDDLEKQVRDHFDEIQFSEAFIKKIEGRLRFIYESKKNAVTGTKSRLVQQKLTLEKKLEAAEEKLIDGVLDDDGFDRAKKRYREQIENLEEQINKLDRTKNIKVDVIQKVLLMVRDIGQAYEKADPELKRLYLGLFWERFEAENRQITIATKSPIITALEAAGSVSYQELTNVPSAENTTLGNEVILNSFRGAYRDSNPG